MDRLGAAEGNILEDAALLASLQQTKATVAEITVAVAEGAAMHARLEAQRSVYAPLAALGADAYALLERWPKCSEAQYSVCAQHRAHATETV